jgi:hypothetical protein
MSIINLQEISPNLWKALYQGNYGKYTIKIKIEGQKIVDFSCSCPSDYYPCKHIPMIEKAINQRIAKNAKNDNEHNIKIDQLLKDLSQRELYDFIVKQAKYNPELKNAILLEFMHKANKKNANSHNHYTQILREALNEFHFDYENVEYLDCTEIEALEQWLDKAQECVDQNNPSEAILICKACIEEYALWYEEQNFEGENFDVSYQERPFDILSQILSMPEVDYKELFDYCKTEILKQKYEIAGMHDGFNSLLADLSILVGSNDFIALQDKLLKEIEDKSSYEAKKILQRKIDFYQNNEQPDKALDIIKENLQIESFRKQLVEELIAENKLKEAKKLINDFISKNENELINSFSINLWYELKLKIAQKEKDIPEIQRTSFWFVKSGFNNKYYDTYKSTFSDKEWEKKMENLILHYEKNYKGHFCSSIADVLQTEGQKERLMKYIEKHLSVDNLVKYYTEFTSLSPEKTLSLFKRAIDEYAKDNMGREHYERIANLLERMVKIKGGRELAREMINQYRLLYKNRKAMMEIINHFSNKLK